MTTVKKKVYQTVRQLAEELLLQEEDPYTYPEILDSIGEEFPGAETSIGCIRWYASHMRERGERLPPRPRAKAGEDRKLKPGPRKRRKK